MPGLWCKTPDKSKNMILVKLHKIKDSEILAIADSDLIGKKIENEKVSIEITERFYKGEQLPAQKIIDLFKNSRNINIIGKESVEFALKHKLIDKTNVIKIKNIPHAQVF